MNEKSSKYSRLFKLQVIEEVASGKITKEEARTKYGIRGKSAVLNWMRKFGFADKLELSDYLNQMKEDDLTENDKLKKRIRELEAALRDAKLKEEFYSRMIERAEQELKIKIRKKSNTKQSSK